ncbi:MAG: hypothetical protein WKH64_08080 [Chloroflexia bacterium]
MCSRTPTPSPRDGARPRRPHDRAQSRAHTSENAQELFDAYKRRRRAGEDLPEKTQPPGWTSNS